MKWIKYLFLIVICSSIYIFSAAQIISRNLPAKSIIKKISKQKYSLPKEIQQSLFKNKNIDYKVWSTGKFIPPNNLGGIDSMFKTTISLFGGNSENGFVNSDYYMLTTDGYAASTVYFQLKLESEKEYRVTFNYQYHGNNPEVKWLIKCFLEYENSGIWEANEIESPIQESYQSKYSFIISPKTTLPKLNLNNSYPVNGRIEINLTFPRPLFPKWQYYGLEIKEIK